MLPAITIEEVPLMINDESVRAEIVSSVGCETIKTAMNNVVNVRKNWWKSRSE